MIPMAFVTTLAFEGQTVPSNAHSQTCQEQRDFDSDSIIKYYYYRMFFKSIAIFKKLASTLFLMGVRWSNVASEKIV